GSTRPARCCGPAHRRAARTRRSGLRSVSGRALGPCRGPCSRRAPRGHPAGRRRGTLCAPSRSGSGHTPRSLLRSCDVYTLVTNVSGFTGDIPAGLDWSKDSESGRAWLAALPQTVVECGAYWRLRLSAPHPYAFTSPSVPAHRVDGSDDVLQFVFIDRDTEPEADALRLW